MWNKLPVYFILNIIKWKSSDPYIENRTYNDVTSHDIKGAYNDIHDKYTCLNEKIYITFWLVSLILIIKIYQVKVVTIKTN